MPERGIYFANGPITDVEFRLVLEYSKPVIDVLQSFDNFTENINEQSISTFPTRLREECTFKWQQKIHFAISEFNTLPGSQTENSPEQQHIIGQDEVPMTIRKQGSRIFTLVDGEEPGGGMGKVTMKLSTPTGEKSLAERIGIFGNRRIEPAMMAHRKPIIDLPHKEHQRKTRNVKRNKQTMYIMAFLGPFQDNMQVYDGNNQYVLCKLTAINGTNIVIEPDLFSMSNTIENCYGIYKARLFIVSNEKFDRVDDASTHQLWFEKEIYAMNDFPSEKTTKLVYLIDIERAVNFPHDGLCIEYDIDLPLQFALVDLSPIHKWSTVVNSRPQEGDDIAVFAQPICATLIIKKEGEFLKDFYWPRIIFRLCGEDYWGRCFVNGFGQLTLPSRPGRHQFNVKCWRYGRHDRKSLLFENFISKKAAELTLANESATCEAGPITSSIGINTLSSGTLKINVQCVMQTQEFMSDEFFYKMKYGTMRRDGMQPRIHWSILKVLSKFEEARRNLIRIRNQSIPTVNNRIS